MSLSHLPTFQTHQQVIRMMKQSSDEQLNNTIKKIVAMFFIYIIFSYFLFVNGSNYFGIYNMDHGWRQRLLETVLT